MAIIAEKLSVANYNKLDNIPVINQDLSASEFTPVANTYYRHTGTTTGMFTQGVIYLYDTAYHKLGESGGTTLNKYTAVIRYDDTNGRKLVLRIIQNAKSFSAYDEHFRGTASLNVENNNYLTCGCTGKTLAGYLIMGFYSWSPNGVLEGNPRQIIFVTDSNNNVTLNYSTITLSNDNILHITYYNDTEIT